MSVEVFRRSIEQIWNNHDARTIERFIAPNYRGIDPAEPDEILGVDGYKQHFIRLTTGFPDLRITIDDAFALGERVAARWTVEATHTGDFSGIPPTGLRVRVTGIEMVLIRSGLIVVEHANSDSLGLLKQLGVIPKSTAVPTHLLF